jgi:hypothetical protein
MSDDPETRPSPDEQPVRTGYPRMTDRWDEPIRGTQYSIVTKRRLLERFRDDPTEETLVRFAGSLWAYRSWVSGRFPVEERMLAGERTPAEFRDFLEAAREGEASIREPETPNLGRWAVSEMLEAMDPDRFATLNADARAGMEALGYPTPGQPMEDGAAYWEFVENATEAVDRYDLLEEVVEPVVGAVPAAVPTVDVAQAAFQLHGDDQFDVDLSRRTRA